MGLVMAGGLLQMVGFGFVAWELWQVQRHEFGVPDFVNRWRNRNLPERPPPTPAMLKLAPAEGRSSTRLELTTGPAPVIPVEKRLDVVEGEIRQLRDKAVHDRGAADEEAKRIRGQLKAEEAKRVGEWEGREKERKDFLSTTLRLQAYGTILFLLGTAMATVGSVT